MHNNVLAVLAFGVILLGIFAMGSLMFGAWWTGSLVGYKLVMVAACLAYLSQALMVLDEMTKDHAPAVASRLGRAGAALWLATIGLSGLSLIVILWTL